ncbi:MAG: arsenite methyltransferase [Anaerolineales bacterium]|nr:MAG: arsenite methyltransferase [Anaerolineales bacterium]
MSDESKVKETVRERYGEIAAQFVEREGPASCCPSQQASCCSPQQASCCGPSQTDVTRFTNAMRLYSAQELSDLPESVADMAMGCGNPTAIAELKPGEVVLDLGSGGGIDCFLAARQVGPQGRAIGLDMTPKMIKLARQNAKKIGATNVEFRYGEMEDMPLPDESVDVIISNCVINLSPDKDKVFSEAYRVLRPGGRLAVSDIVTYGPLPEVVRSSLEAWAGCVAGALDETVYLDKMRLAGFTEVEVTTRNFAEIEQWAELGEPPEPVQYLDELGGKVASIKVTARKP